MNFIPAEYHQYIPTALLTLSGLTLFCFLLSIFLYLKTRENAKDSQKKREIIKKVSEENKDLQEEILKLRVREGKILTLLKNERKSAKEKLLVMEEAKEQLSLQFQSLANRIFDEKSERFSTENGERVTSLLKPLQEQLHTFRKRIDDIQLNETRERTSLKEEILHLRELNQQINKEAVNLSRALRGDKKIQGNWGEMVLERVLEQSGLRKEKEYSVQKGYRNTENHLLKPDVVIHLPDNRSIIVDSKVSLLAWEKYINSEDEDKEAHLKEHIGNIRNHVKGLSGKDYSEISGLNSLDFVLLFIPIDSSFTTACQTDEKLFADAYSHRIIIVSPTTLLATLRTVENLWRYEQQNQNAQEIADRAGSLYDKLCGFLEDMEKVGKQLATCTSTYDSAMNKLTRGRGNVVSQAEKFTQLGVKAKKKIPASMESLPEKEIPN